MWILVSILALILVLLALVIYVWKKKGRRETDYKAFFYMGLIWMVIGGAYMLIRNDYTLGGLFAMGVVFFIVGLVNKNKWGKDTRMTEQGRKRVMVMTLVGITVLVLGILAFLLFV